MLIFTLLILLLAATSKKELNYNFVAEYIKVNRIVFLIFILGAYIAYNTLDVIALESGLDIYGGVFKVSIISQIFDIILFLLGALVAILTCFIPYDLELSTGSSTNKGNSNINLDLYSSLNKNKDTFSFNQYIGDSYSQLYSISSIKTLEKKKEGLFIYRVLVYPFNKFLTFLANIKIETMVILNPHFNSLRLEVKEYSFLLMFTIIGASFLISSRNLVSLYLSLELQSFTLYVLSASQIRSFRGTSGGLKYFLLGGLSSGIILLGSSLLYAYTGTLNLDEIFMMYSDDATNPFIDPWLLILFAGLLFKVSAAPFHNWAPDVYSDVPTYSTTWLIIIVKVSVLVLMLILIHNIHSGLDLNNLSILEEYNTENINENNIPKILKNNSDLFDYKEIPFSLWNPTYSSLGLWTNVLTLCAFLSLIIGTVVGLSQSRIKRLFAYSTISHVGFLLLALSINTITSLDAFLFYLIQYTMTNLNLFFILIAWGYLYSNYYLNTKRISIKIEKWNLLSQNKNNIKYIGKIKEEVSNNNKEHYYSKENNINTIYNYLLIKDNNQDHYDFYSDNTEWQYTPVPFLTNLKGMQSTDPFLAFCLAITLFSLAGIPPLIGFFAKQQVLLASMQMDYFFLSIVVIFTSVFGAAYYLRLVKFIYFYDDVFIPYYLNISYNKNFKYSSDNNFISNPHFIINPIDNNYYIPMLPSNNLSLIIAVLTNISLFYILKPYLLMNLIYIITLPLFYG